MDEMNGTSGGLGVMVHGVDQMLADKRATKSYEREKSLMLMQNRMNLANAKMAPSIQAEGLRMAGFNPAMVAGAGTSPAPTVSKGSADMAQTLPFDVGGVAQLMLLDAQRKNIEAQTEKTKAETENVPKTGKAIEAGTELTIAQTLNEGKKGANIEADTARVNAEAQRIKNLNEQWKDQNEAMSFYSQSVATEWQQSDWYKKLDAPMKRIIDQMASGAIPMTIGSFDALITYLRTAKDIDKQDRDQFENAISKTVIKAQLDDPKVMEAKIRTPLADYNLTNAQKAHVDKMIEKLKKEIPWISSTMEATLHNINADTNLKNAERDIKLLQKKMQEAVNKSFEVTDPGYNLYEGRPLGYLNAMAQKALEHIMGAFGILMTLFGSKEAYEAFKGIKGVKSDSPSRGIPSIKEIEADPNDPRGIKKAIRGAAGRKSSGVHNFRFKTRRFT